MLSRAEITLVAMLGAAALVVLATALLPPPRLHRGLAPLTVHYEVVPMPEDLGTYRGIRIDQHPRWAVRR